MGGIDVRIDRFWHPLRNRPVLVITADLSGTAPESRPAVIARLAPVQPGAGEMRVLGEDSFRIVSSEDGVRLAQGRVVAEPGSYVLTVMVADPVKVETRLHQIAVTVAGDPGGLRLSDVVAADALSPLEFRSLASYDEPYIIGPFNVVPKVRETYQAGDTVRVFFEVYGAAAPFKVSYQLEGEELDGTWVPLGQPSAAEQTGASQGWEVSTGTKWPLGNYRIRIEVEDAGGARIETSLPFTLEAATEG